VTSESVAATLRINDALGDGPGLVGDVQTYPTVAQGYGDDFVIGPTR